MKTHNRFLTNLTRTVAVLTVAGLLTLPTLAATQEKGATKLIKLNPFKTEADAEAVQPGDTVVMSGPKCKDSWATIVTPATKTDKLRAHLRDRVPAWSKSGVQSGSLFSSHSSFTLLTQHLAGHYTESFLKNLAGKLVCRGKNP